MASSSSPTCNFTLQSSLDLGVSFQSASGEANWGSQITIFAPASSGPVTTGLWDSDGNIFFTIYLSANPSVNCKVNFGSDPMVWASEAGLSCDIGEPVPQPDGGYNCTLIITESSAITESGSATRAAATKHVARMVLPQGGREAWTQIMMGQAPVPDDISAGSPVVMAWTRFDDGTQVAGGVYKSVAPSEYNIKFMWVFDASGNQYADWLIDVGDDQDFYDTSYAFSLTPGGDADHLLDIVERSRKEDIMDNNDTNDTNDTNDYRFSVGLLDASQNPATLQVWQSGTLEINLNGNPSVSGVLSLPGFYSEPIPFSGQMQQSDSQAWTMVTGAGQTSQVQIDVTAQFRNDGFLFNGTYIAGLVSMLDFSAQETYLYVLQGLSPQGPFGKGFRDGASLPDKRISSISPQIPS